MLPRQWAEAIFSFAFLHHINLEEHCSFRALLPLCLGRSYPLHKTWICHWDGQIDRTQTGLEEEEISNAFLSFTFTMTDLLDLCVWDEVECCSASVAVYYGI